MQVEFATNRLQRCYNAIANGSRSWGPSVARRYIQRIDVLREAENISILYGIRSLRLHRLSGRRRGRFSISLDRRWRIILSYVESENKVRIEEVTNHYGD